jgi:NADPH:quinone reductase-like Zn-dependent oxidoreductase
MRHVVIRRPGGYEQLTIEEAAEPVPGAGEVRVSTRAIGVNFADCVVRMGLYQSARELVGWPITPGFEFSGVVSAVGPNVNGYSPGDRVVGVSRFGAYSSEVVTPAALLRPLPTGLDFAQAAGFPVAYLTGWYAVRELVRLRAGQRVLIHSAAGGVGSALIQLCKQSGAFVVGVVGAPHKVAVAKELGADAVIDKSHEDLWSAVERHSPKGYHVVLDGNGAETLKQSYAHLSPTGRLVIYGYHSMLVRGKARANWLKLAWHWLRTPRFDPFTMTNENRGVLAFNLSYLFDEMDLAEVALTDLFGGLERGELRALPTQTLPFEEVAEAHRRLHSGESVGKIVLTLPER